MKQNFICPRCNGYLNVGNQIILTAKNSQGNAGIILFSPEIGNYSTEKNPLFETSEGERYEFLCPLCHEKLASRAHDNLSHILMTDEDKKKYQILFSKIAGEKSTYKIIGESTEVYGEHRSNYINFINLSQTN